MKNNTCWHQILTAPVPPGSKFQPLQGEEEMFPSSHGGAAHGVILLVAWSVQRAASYSCHKCVCISSSSVLVVTSSTYNMYRLELCWWWLSSAEDIKHRRPWQRRAAAATAEWMRLSWRRHARLPYCWLLVAPSRNSRRLFISLSAHSIVC